MYRFCFRIDFIRRILTISVSNNLYNLQVVLKRLPPLNTQSYKI